MNDDYHPTNFFCVNMIVSVLWNSNITINVKCFRKTNTLVSDANSQA